MLKRLTSRELLELLSATWETTIRLAWIEAVNSIRSGIVLKRIVERLERGDLPGAIRALNLDESAYSPLSEALRQAYNAGGVATVDQMPALRDPEGYRLVVRFDMRNPEAETWLRDHSSTLITRIHQDQVVAIRESLSAGLERGDNPTRTALNVVGRVNRATGRREGGVIGLTSQQARYVQSATQELLSGDPEALRHYLTRERRDKRFDKTVLKAIAEEKSLPIETVNRITGRYSDGLLKLRGDMIARTETMAALNASQVAAYRQAIGEGKIDAQAVVKVWHSARDDRVRYSHSRLNGQRVGINGRFTSPYGSQLEYPGDPKAPTFETVGCRCWMQVRVDHLAGLE